MSAHVLCVCLHEFLYVCMQASVWGKVCLMLCACLIVFVVCVFEFIISYWHFFWQLNKGIILQLRYHLC